MYRYRCTLRCLCMCCVCVCVSVYYSDRRRSSGARVFTGGVSLRARGTQPTTTATTRHSFSFLKITHTQTPLLLLGSPAALGQVYVYIYLYVLQNVAELFADDTTQPQPRSRSPHTEIIHTQINCDNCYCTQQARTDGRTGAHVFKA